MIYSAKGLRFSDPQNQRPSIYFVSNNLACRVQYSALHIICICSKKKFSLKAESYFRPFLSIYFTWLVLLFHFDTQQRWIFLHWFLSALIVLLNLVGQFAMMSLPFPQNGCLTHYPFTGKSPIVWFEIKEESCLKTM